MAYDVVVGISVVVEEGGKVEVVVADVVVEIISIVVEVDKVEVVVGITSVVEVDVEASVVVVDKVEVVTPKVVVSWGDSQFKKQGSKALKMFEIFVMLRNM